MRMKIQSYRALLAIPVIFTLFAILRLEEESSWENFHKIGAWTMDSFNTLLETGLSFSGNHKDQDCLILLWAHKEVNIEVPKHPLCNGGCEVTYNRSRIGEASAVVFMMKKMKLKDLPDPSERRQDQVYVWYCRESPWTSKFFHRKTLTNWKEYFNWTMTYRFDSDVDGSMIPFTARPFLNYMYKKNQEANLSLWEEDGKFSEFRKYIFTTSASYCEKNRNTSSPIPDVFKKIGVAVWRARNCFNTKGAKLRLKMIKEMISDGLQVGGGTSCLGGTNHVLDIKDMYDLISGYKFYLAFENSYHCRDYITEKNWFNSFYLGIVPVVWGGKKEDYIRMAPPNSFIFYEDFSSSKEIVEYLQYLDKNDTAYMEYFSWRKLYPCNYPLYKLDDAEEYPFASSNKHSPFLNAYCSLCKMLKDGLHLSKKQTIHSLNKYWYKNERAKCLVKNN